MKYVRKIILFIAIAACFITVGYSVKGNEKMVYSDIFHDALTEEGFANFFDVNRGKPNIEWIQDQAYIKSGYLYSLNNIESSEYILSVDVKAKGDHIKFRMDFGRYTGKSSFAQITLDSKNNSVNVYNGSNSNVTYDYSGQLKSETWYQLKVVVKETKMLFYIDGKQVAQMDDAQGFKGKFTLRSTGDEIYLKNLSCYETAGIPVVNQSSSVGIITGYDDIVLPGKSQDVAFYPATDSAHSSVRVEVSDSNGTVYEKKDLTLNDGKYAFQYIPRGNAGVQKVRFYDGTALIGEASVYVDARTIVITNNSEFNNFYNTLIRQVTTRNQPVYNFDDHTFKMHMSWLRDHIHMMEAGRYWQSGYKEVLDFWFDNQHPDGFFYEMIVDPGTAAWKSYTDGSDEKFYKEMEDGRYILRFEIEADIEYLVVDAAYMAWHSTGDSEWMVSHIPNLEKALNWIMKNPERWSKEYGLPIRGSSVDTYDFTYGHNTGNRSVVWWEEGMEWGTPMAVFHGDCTGFAQACNQLAEMYLFTGNTKKAEYWKKVSDSVLENLAVATWNGNYFAHMVQVHPKLEDLPADWQEDLSGDWTRLSYSNSCALNRDVLTKSQAVSIINSFKALRDNPPKQETTTGYSEEELFAEWVTIYPSYRKKEYVKYDPGCYINGSVAPFCGGELAQGCFKWGYADYGYDIITRLKNIWKRDGALKFFYQQNGEIYYYSGKSSGGPDAWGAATVHNAIVEGLGGVDNSSVMSNAITLSPSWTVTEYSDVYVQASYAENNKYIAYTSAFNREDGIISYDIVGDYNNITLNMLMPEGKIPQKVTVNGKEVKFDTLVKEHSGYTVVSCEKSSNTDIDSVVVYLENGKLPEQNDPPSHGAVLNPWATPNPDFPHRGKSGVSKKILTWGLFALEIIAALGIAMATAVFFAKKSVKNKK